MDIAILGERDLTSFVFKTWLYGETGESRLFAICITHLLSALLVVLACNTATVNVWVGQVHKLAYCISPNMLALFFLVGINSQVMSSGYIYHLGSLQTL